jgi:hypothetical protein
VRAVHATRMTSRAAMMAIFASLLAFSGCGDDDGFGNKPPPPAEITVSVTIAPRGVTASPSRVGAGPIELLVSNQTGTSQRLTLQSETSDNGGRKLRQSTGPINPGDTASLKAHVDRGTYTVSAGDGAIGPGRIHVGPARRHATDRLLQP